jgi:thiol-disulfide isomerase/thioredoxin
MFSSSVISLINAMRRSSCLMKQLVERLAIRLSEQATLAKSLVMVILSAGMFLSATAWADGRMAASFTGATHWLNSAPLNGEMLRGKVVMIDFWSYSCSNCLAALPHVKAWDKTYRTQGLVVIGVHTPEFPEAMSQQNVEREVIRLGVTFPVALDEKYVIWDAYGNKYWPAQYLIDAQGRLRYQHYGEGAYDEIESNIQTLIKESQQDAGLIKN